MTFYFIEYLSRKINTYSLFLVRTAILLLVLTPLSLGAQFYRGSHQIFGKNRIQYVDKNWEHYDFEKFNIYFYDAGKDLGVFAAKTAKEGLREVEKKFDYRLRGKAYILVFSNLEEFRGSNIGLGTGEEQNIGGTVSVSGNKIFVYFDGNHARLEKQVKEGLARMLMFQMGYGEDWKEVIKNTALLNIPEWYSEGVVSYAVNGNTPEINNTIRDVVMRGDFDNISRLEKNEAKAAGHAIWNYIAQIYGEEVIPNIVYMTKISRNIENGLLFVLGISMDRLLKDAGDYYKSKYMMYDRAATVPRGEKQEMRSRRNRSYSKPALNKNGTKMAFVTNQSGQQKVYVRDLEKGRNKRILKTGHRLDREPETVYPILDWHPQEDILAVVYRKQANIIMELHDFAENDKQRIEMRRVDKVIDVKYAPDGKSMVMSAVSKGRTNLYVFNMLTRSQVQITDDLYDYLYPEFLPDGKRIIFSSNRPDNQIVVRGRDKTKPQDAEFADNLDVFIYDYENENPQLTRVTETPGINETHPSGINERLFTYLSGKTGTINRYSANIDSTISRIDTTIHYRYFTQEVPVTNYSRNILSHDVNRNANQVLDILLENGKYVFYTTPLNTVKVAANSEDIDIQDTRLAKTDTSGRPARPRSSKIEVTDIEEVTEKETIKEGEVDINEYAFEGDDEQKTDLDPDAESDEKRPVKNSRYVKLEPDTASESEKKPEFTRPNQEIYRRTFLPGEQAVQFDWNFANSLYQRFNGGPWVAPGMGLVAKTDVVELMEDYIFEGGIRYAVNGNSNEVFGRFINRKKRLNKEYIFQRQALSQQPGVATLVQSNIYKGSVVLTYPFSEVSAVRFTPSYRMDQNVVRATDINTLREPNAYDHWAGIKLEYIFDNVRNLALNLNRGMRMKVFGEFYTEMNQSQTDFFVVGLDFRHYTKIHRHLIWANRISQSTSLGNRRLVYYMGGTDNWIQGTGDQFDFDNEVPTDRGYFFQTIATPMRGFLQNARNGNSFALLNSEIRWPVFEYFSLKPLKSEFLQHFQVVAFADVGTAWTGVNPYSDENSFNVRNIRRGGSSVNIKLRNQIDPLIGGTGLGLRSKLLGYFVRFDYAWGVEDGLLRDTRAYFSLGLDF